MLVLRLSPLAAGLALSLATAGLTGCGSDAPAPEPGDAPATLEPIDQASPEISDAYSPAAPAGGTAGLFFSMTGQTAPDTLIGAAYLGAEIVEVHETVEGDDGMREMREVEGGIAIPAGETVALEPGAYHVMLVNLAETTAEGDSIDVSLEFARSGSVPVRVPIVGLGDIPRP